MPENPIETKAEATIEELHRPVSVVDTREGFSQALEQLSNGIGPFAADAERASGYRYGQKPYLIQFYREGSGVFLFDPPALGDLSELNRVIGNQEVILHAALQDLPNLRSHGITINRVFDTEVSARLLNLERVGLAALLENLLGIVLAKSHSAADWSTRPLPDSWLIYAALDVEYLPQLATELKKLLHKANKAEIANEEFEHILQLRPAEASAEPWRKTNGLHNLKTLEELRVLKQLWLSRDELAQELDSAPGRVVPDSSLVVLAQKRPQNFAELNRIKEFTGKYSRSEAPRWLKAVLDGLASREKLELRPKSHGIPQPRNWEQRNPEAFVRFTLVREAIREQAEKLNLPIENLLTPEYLRKVAWQPPAPLSKDTIAEFLQEQGARNWQIAATAELINNSFVESVQKLPAATESKLTQSLNDSSPAE